VPQQRASESRGYPADSIGNRVARDEFLSRIDGMVYGPDPREGYFRGSEFIHPELRFRLVFPDGWKTQNQKQAVVGVNQNQNAILQLTLAQGGSAQAAASAFLGQEGLQSTAPQRRTINGLPAVTAEFAATTQQGALRGLAVFIEQGSNVYQLLGYSTEQAWSANSSAIDRSLSSFGPVSDPALLNVQPTRVEVVRLDRATTLSELAQRAGAGSIEELVLLNQVSADTRFDAGTRVKRLTGAR
jgi:predicted Zn-dependent protease